MTGPSGERVPAVTIRPAAPEDVPAMDRLIRELAVYEREPDAVEATPEDLSAALFAPSPRLHAHVAEVDGEVVGMALWFVTYSTWRGRHGIWLEDLFVSPSSRGEGVGRLLLQALARECLERGFRRLEWTVLNWNTDAQGFYQAIGARPQDEWTTWRLEYDALTDAAAD